MRRLKKFRDLSKVTVIVRDLSADLLDRKDCSLYFVTATFLH